MFRAISRLKDIEVDYSATARPEDRQNDNKRAVLPLADPALSENEIEMVRGCADVKALRLRHHNSDLRHSNFPSDNEADLTLDAMEQARCESLGARKMAGVAKNITSFHENRLATQGYTDADFREDIPLPEAMHALTWLTLTGSPTTPALKRIADLWLPLIKEKVPEEDLSDLASVASDQRAFTNKAKTILGRIGLSFEDETSEGEEEQESQENAEENGADNQSGPESMESSPGEMSLEEEENSEPAPTQSDLELDQGDSEGELQEAESPGSPVFERPEGYIPDGEGFYRVYTTQFDEVVQARDLADLEELSTLRASLDNQLSHLHGVVTKLANKLHRRLMARQQRSWQFDLEEGVLDTSRLSRIIADPNTQLTYKQETETEFRDTVVTLLIDNSGSMRGRPITIAAISTDILARTLERAGVKVEILGFTTSEWKGGRSRQLWTESGSPSKPGRLNDLRHIVYKSADAPWRRTYKNIGLMLKEGVLKENIDGEALAWAYNRLARRQERRKILMVISDGAPVDDSTLSVNPSNILERDLKNIIQWIENKSQIELTAIGIGHDVARYYSKAITITDADMLAEALTTQLIDLFELDPRKRLRR